MRKSRRSKVLKSNKIVSKRGDVATLMIEINLNSMWITLKWRWMMTKMMMMMMRTASKRCRGRCRKFRTKSMITSKMMMTMKNQMKMMLRCTNSS